MFTIHKASPSATQYKVPRPAENRDVPRQPLVPADRTIKAYEEKPNRLVIAAIEKLVRLYARAAKLSIYMTPEELAKLNAYYESGHMVIAAMNHASMLDGPSQILLEILSGYRNTKMAARDVVFECPVRLKTRVPGRSEPITLFECRNLAKVGLMRRLNIFSVTRELDGTTAILRTIQKLVAGKHVAMALPGRVIDKTQAAPEKDYRLGAAWIALATSGIFMERNEVLPDGTPRQALAVPITFIYELKGDADAIRKAMGKEVGKLEKKMGKAPNAFPSGGAALRERLEALFASVVLERESRYQKTYPGLKLSPRGTDFYQRLTDLVADLVALLEQRYKSLYEEALRADWKPLPEPLELKARKLKGRIQSLPRLSPDNRRDMETLDDLMKLADYERGYLNDHIGTQFDMLCLLVQSVCGKDDTVLGKFSLLRAAEIEVRVRIGDAVDSLSRLAGQPHPDKEPRRKMAEEMTQKMQGQHQQHLNEAFSSTEE